MKAFSIYDKKAEGYNTPFFQKTFGLAERAFKEAAKDEQSQISKNKDDFELYYLGDFDETSGEFTPLTPPKHVCSAH